MTVTNRARCLIFFVVVPRCNVEGEQRWVEDAGQGGIYA